MNALKYLTIAVSSFLSAGQLQAADTGLQQLVTKSQEMTFLNCEHKSSSSSHRHHRESIHKPAYLSASTPLNYGGQNLPDVPVAATFGVIGDVSSPVPLSEDAPGIFTVQRSGHYLINWSCTAQNDSTIDGVGFSAVLVTNGNTQNPPFVQLALLGVSTDGSTPDTATASGSLILQLVKGETVQLRVQNLADVSGLLLQSASISFVRVAING